MMTETTAGVPFLIHPPHPGGPEPTSGQLPFFILITVIESLAFAENHRGRALAVYLGTAWFLVNWVPHTALHIYIGENMGALLRILAAAAMAVGFAPLLLQKQRA